ncbi:MAG: DUF2127 domain-containing protein [Yoonia sp.]|uniref:DUF2127 domain-containing protein n=1 Tax=Yoonia sp. TaxID=2212373 RepID=UPI00273E197A|nr:DUF2127 domain-containing protein [Yoonia sp.]MDP5083945.1 DUF2127 domain-containing protein [Yoonia sp.]
MSANGPILLNQHQFFVVTLTAKGLLGLLQVMIAAALSLGVTQDLPQFAQWLVQNELTEDPSDFLASHILTWAQMLPASDTSFYTVYFAAHGTLHLVVVAALLGGARWAHHAAIIVLSAFVVYQIFEWFSVGGAMLIVLTAIDLLVIYLTVQERRA